MRIDGQWYECDDGITRPVVRGEILTAEGTWEPTLFLVDTGADCTVISAAVLDVLGFSATVADRQLGGVGGVTKSVEISTSLRLPQQNGGLAIFRGQYAAFTELESLDMCVLGRDVLGMFAVIVDRPNEIVAIISQRHRYRIEAT